jgi:hypothetical protein
MSSAGIDGAFEVAVEPRNDRYDPDDDGWRDQVNTLYAAVARAGGPSWPAGTAPC